MPSETAEFEVIEPTRIVLTSPEDTITLKQLVHGDAVDYFGLVDEDRAHLSQHGDTTAEKYPTLESVERSIELTPPDIYRFGIWEDEHMVGFIKLTPHQNGEIETGSWVSSKEAGNGYAHRARQIALKFAFDTLGVDKVMSEIAVGNDASRKSVERSGYVLVGEKDEKWHYELSKEAFESQQE